MNHAHCLSELMTYHCDNMKSRNEAQSITA